jgi:hypothetical protein
MTDDNNCVCHETSSRNCPVHQNAREEKPREFWITVDDHKCLDAYWREPQIAYQTYHVIEHSAYAALQKENELLKLDRDNAMSQFFNLQNKASEGIITLEKEITSLRESLELAVEGLEYIEKYCELVRYEWVGGDGAPSGHLPYAQDMKFISEALATIKAKHGGL